MCAFPAPSYMRKDAPVPPELAAADHEPAMAVWPPELVRQGFGSVIVASRPVGSPAATLVGSAPLNTFSVGGWYAQVTVPSVIDAPVPLGPLPAAAEVPATVAL